MRNFNFPNIDHLVEGFHYRLAGWDFEECEQDEKMVFGMCRKLGQKTGEKEFDSGKKSKQETEGESEATRQGSNVGNNKAVKVGSKKMGWAVKDGKPVLVEWGSVAGEKKAPPKPPASPTPKPKTPAPVPPAVA
jgi:hypothetical protein